MKEVEKKNSEKTIAVVEWLSVAALFLIVVILIFNSGIFNKEKKIDNSFKTVTQIGEFQKIEGDKFFYIDRTDLMEKSWNLSDKTGFFENNDKDEQKLEGKDGIKKGELVIAYFTKKVDLDNMYPEKIVVSQSKFTGFVVSYQDKVLTVEIDKLGNKISKKFMVDEKTIIMVKNSLTGESYSGSVDDLKNNVLVSVDFKDLGSDHDGWAESVEVILSGE